MDIVEIYIFIYLLTLFVGGSIYWYLTKPFKHWVNREVYHLKPQLIFGNIKERVLFKKSFHLFQLDIYNQLKGHRYAGFYEGRKAVLMILDPDLLKNILVRDFDHFVDRPVLRFNSSTFIENMLINLKGHKWKSVRAIMTPAFSSGKLKLMESLIRICAKQMEQYLDKTIASKGDNGPSDGIEMKDFFGRFTMDVIASCAFGVQCNSLQEPNAEFFKITSKFSEISIFKRLILFFVLLFIPQYSKYFPISFFNLDTIKFLGDVVINTKQHRFQNNENRRNDFLQLMLDAHMNETNEKNSSAKTNTTDYSTKASFGEGNEILTEDVIVAQSVLFLIAGFETSSTLLTFASYELALNPDVQEKLRKEILSVLDKYDGECNYAALSEMNYLEMVLNETLRKHPPIGRTDRVCTKPYQIPDSKLVIYPGESVCISIMGLHYDPEYYPDPEKFDPERFSPDVKNERSPYVFLPFGAGPRNCIGLRFAMITVKSALAHLLKKHKFTVCKKTEIPVILNKMSMLLSAKNGMWLNVEKL